MSDQPRPHSASVMSNTISGRVVLQEEPDVGIHNVLVVIHDVSRSAMRDDTPPSRDASRLRSTAPSTLGDRLGSRLTDKMGAFSFSFEDDEFRIRNGKQKRPDVLLVVLAPEAPGSDAS